MIDKVIGFKCLTLCLYKLTNNGNILNKSWLFLSDLLPYSKVSAFDHISWPFCIPIIYHPLQREEWETIYYCTLFNQTLNNSMTCGKIYDSKLPQTFVSIAVFATYFLFSLGN